MSLDAQVYRAWEQLAKTSGDTWRLAQKHNLDVFEKVGFPVRMDNIRQLRSLVDTMQENRFDAYMGEMGGFSQQELDLFLAACVDVIRFQAILFPDHPPMLPLDTLISAFSVYSKVSRLRPGFKTLLELGPGCGYLSFFLKQHQGLENYSQVEACESFFLLQSRVNEFNFQEGFHSKVAIGDPAGHPSYYPALPSGYTDSAQKPLLVNFQRSTTCCQYPWWNLAALERQEIQFDVVTSNANLLEFSTEALYDYLALISRKMAPEGVFFVQCFGGGGTVGRQIEPLWKALYDFGFAPQLITSNLFLDVDALLAQIPDEARRIVLAPAGLTARQLVADSRFRDRFEFIRLVDNNRAGQETAGVPVIAPSEVSGADFDLALVLHDNKEIRGHYDTLFRQEKIDTLSLHDLPGVMRRFAVPYGVFIRGGHPDFEHCYRRDAFSLSGVFTEDSSIQNAFFSLQADAAIHSRDQLASCVQQRLNDRSVV